MELGLKANVFGDIIFLKILLHQSFARNGHSKSVIQLPFTMHPHYRTCILKFKSSNLPKPPKDLHLTKINIHENIKQDKIFLVFLLLLCYFMECFKNIFFCKYNVVLMLIMFLFESEEARFPKNKNDVFGGNENTERKLFIFPNP